MTFWSRWAAAVTGHPLACGLVALALLVRLIVPVFSLRLGQEDVGATPEATTERQAFDLMAARYGPGYNGPLVTAVELSPLAHPSKACEDKYNQAKANQADLERKQKELTAEANSLKAQQASLEQQEAELQAQERQLQQQQAQIGRQRVALEAAIRANLRAQAALTARVARDRDRVRVRLLERVAPRVCRVAPPTPACERAKDAVAAAQATLAADQQALAAKKAQLASLKRQAAALAREAA